MADTKRGRTTAATRPDEKSIRTKRRPALRFRRGTLLFIWFASFLGCFVMYMLGTNLFGEEMTESSSATESIAAEATESTAAPVVNPLPESSPKSSTYYAECAFVGDSITLGLADYQIVPANYVLASVGMNLEKINTELLTTTYGSLTVLDALKEAKPEHVYIMLGSNGIAWLTIDDMITRYTAFALSVQETLPDADIYVLSIPPVTAARETAAENPILNTDIDSYNSRLLQMANEKGYYYVDTNTALKGNDGKLPAADANDDGMHFQKATYTTLTSYILSHTAE